MLELKLIRVSKKRKKLLLTILLLKPKYSGITGLKMVWLQQWSRHQQQRAGQMGLVFHVEWFQLYVNLVMKSYDRCKHNFDDSVQDCSSSIGNTWEIMQSYNKPSMLCFLKSSQFNKD